MTVAELEVILTGRLDKLEDTLKKGEKKVSDFADAATKKTQAVSAAFDFMGERVRAAGAALTASLTAPIIALAKSSVDAAIRFANIERGLTAVMGSSARAREELVKLRKVAELPGLGFEEAARGSIRLQAAGVSANLARDAILGFGNALATVGGTKAELDGVITALTQIQSKGVVSAEEINQLAERIPQIRQIMVQAFGTANTEILQKAKITSQEFISIIVGQINKLPKAAKGPGEDFESAWEGALDVLREIGKVLLPELTKFLRDQVVPATKRMTEWLKSLNAEGKQSILKFGALAIALGPGLGLAGMMAGAITNGIKLIKVLKDLKIAAEAAAVAQGVTTTTGATGLAAAPVLPTATVAAAALLPPVLMIDMKNEIIRQQKEFSDRFKRNMSNDQKWVVDNLVKLQKSLGTYEKAKAALLSGYNVNNQPNKIGTHIGTKDAERWIDGYLDGLEKTLQKATNKVLDKQRGAFEPPAINFSGPIGPNGSKIYAKGPVLDAAKRAAFYEELAKRKKKSKHPLIDMFTGEDLGASLGDTLGINKWAEEAEEVAARIKAALRSIEVEKAKLGDPEGVKMSERLGIDYLDYKQGLKSGNADLQALIKERGNYMTEGEVRAKQFQDRWLYVWSWLNDTAVQLKHEAEMRAESFRARWSQIWSDLADMAKKAKEEQIAYENMGGYKLQAQAHQQALAAQRAAIQEHSEKIKSIAEDITRSVTDAVMGVFSNLGRGFNGFVDGIVGGAQRMIAEISRQFLQSQITSWISKLVGGFIGGGMGPLSDAASGGGWLPAVTGRAVGGPVLAGNAYMVNEHGQEFFVPSTNGRIMSASQGGGSTIQVVNNFVFPNGDADSFRQSEGQIGARMTAAAQRALARNS